LPNLSQAACWSAAAVRAITSSRSDCSNTAYR
jgi:hypothetical protein